MTFPKFLFATLFLFLFFASVARGQCPNGPCPDRIQRNGGKCIVKTDGSLDCSAAPGKSITLTTTDGGTVTANGSPVGGATSTIVDVSASATAGTGADLNNCWTGWDTAVTWSADTEYHFRKGWFCYATSPNFLKTNIALTGEAGTFLKHTGTSGNAFTMQSPDPGVEWIHRARVSNLTIIGNWTVLAGSGAATNGANQVVGTGTAFLTAVAIGDSISFDSAMSTESRVVTAIADDTHLTVSANWAIDHAGGMEAGKTRNGVYLNSVRNATFTNVSVKDVVNACVYTENLVTNTFERFVCSYHEPTQNTGFVIRPQYGIVLDANTTTETFVEPIIEGTQAIGIWTKGVSYGNTFINGTSEGNKGKGAFFDSVGNVVINTNFEANDGNDIDIDDARNTFIQIVSEGLIHLTAGAGNKFVGGELTNITIADGVDLTTVDGSLVNGVITDNNGGVFTSNILPRVMTLDGGIRFDSRHGNVIPRGETLTPVSNNISTNAQRGSNFFVSINAPFTMVNPTNGVYGNLITWTIENSAATGPHAITWGNKFKCPDGKTFPTTIAPNGRMIATASYFTSNDVWTLNACVDKNGAATFAGAATKVVSFAVNEQDTNYQIHTSGNVEETFWITNKLTSGFTINSSNATSTAIVDWRLLRP
jgi:hypothetical protein